MDPRLVASIISVESRFKKYAVTRERDGEHSIGLMQIKIRTAREMGFRGAVRKLYLPWVNIYYGVRYLKRQMSRYRFVWDAVSAYNGGRSLWNADLGRYGNQKYVSLVWKRYSRFGVFLRNPRVSRLALWTKKQFPAPDGILYARSE